MTGAGMRIMLVASDADLIEALVGGLSRAFDAQITCVCDAASAIRAEALEPHDLIVLDQSGDGAAARQVGEFPIAGDRPVVLLCHELDGQRLLEAMRAGVFDAFRKPLDMGAFLDSARRALAGRAALRQKSIRYRKMRELVRRVVRERRDLNRRVELVCRDLVEAHRRLAYRVVEFQKSNPA